MFGTISNKRKKGILHDANFLSWEGNYNFRRTFFSSIELFPFLGKKNCLASLRSADKCLLPSESKKFSLGKNVRLHLYSFPGQKFGTR